MKINEIIIAPIMTEKATNMAANKEYTFEVHSDSSKPQIKQALERIYSVKVKNVRIMNRKGMEVKRGRKMVSKKLTNVKVAFVKLKEGKIDLFPQA